MSTLSPNNDAAVSGTSPKTIAVIVVILAFAAGVITGMIGDRILLLVQHRLMPPHRGFIAARVADRLDHDLHLTPSQRTAVTDILKRREQRISEMMSKIRPQMRTEADQTNREIEAVLTPEQRAKFIDIRSRSHRPIRWFFGPP